MRQLKSGSNLIKQVFESEIWEGKRKFTIMLIVIFVGVFCRLQNLIDGHDFTLLIKDVSITFMGANLVKHIINTANDYLLLGKRGQLNEVKESILGPTH